MSLKKRIMDNSCRFKVELMSRESKTLLCNTTIIFRFSDNLIVGKGYYTGNSMYLDFTPSIGFKYKANYKSKTTSFIILFSAGQNITSLTCRVY